MFHLARHKSVIGWHLVLLSCLFAPSFVHSDDRHIGGAIKDVPIFDAHMHYKEPAWSPYPVTTVIELMDKSGVAMALVSSTPDEGTIKLWQFAPNRIVPELRPYHGSAGSSNWTKVEGMADYIRGRLEKYPHEGIGEFHLHSVDMNDEPLLREIVAMAKERNILIHVHSAAGPVDWLYRLEPGLTILWAHAGMSEPPEVVEEMLAKHKTLHTDTSYRELDILAGEGGIAPNWRRVLQRFPDRFLVGSDTWVNSQWANYEGLIDINRRWLSHLPKDIAEMIAYKNAERLFNRKIGRNLIGSR